MRRIRRRARAAVWVWLLAAGLLAGCGPVASQPEAPAGVEAVDLVAALPGAGVLAGWAPAGEAEVYERENLFSLVNGQAELYFVYGFEQAVVQTYESDDGGTIRLTLWRVATAGDAYGLFTLQAAGSAGTAVEVGNGGLAEAGERLVFWQDRVYVDLFASPPQPDDGALLALAGATSAGLPAGGTVPAVMGRLPAGGLVARSEVFFHHEMAIQDRVWLGGENLLGLSSDTDGALARYDVQGAEVELLVVMYATEQEARAGLKAVQGAGLEGPAASGVEGALLAAAWGGADEAATQELLGEVLGGE